MEESQKAPEPEQLVLKGFEKLFIQKKGKYSKLKEFRLKRMMSKAELAKKAGISPITISRIEAGYPARLETKRKILQALELSFADRYEIFNENGKEET